MTRYVVGFMFSLEHDAVLLIQKARPDWQQGKLNGVGGHVEDGEELIDAMVREFREEIGVVTKPEDWEYRLSIAVPQEDYEVHFFRAFGNLDGLADMQFAYGTPDEPVVIARVSMLSTYYTLPNVKWLVPLCLAGNIEPFTAKAA